MAKDPAACLWLTRGAEKYTDDLESQSQMSWDQDLIVKKQMLAHAYTMWW